ncbi:MAG: hypothetical protein HKN88_10385 [Gammaproteobacteria bacterium]|nr:hypothetical protein [Gammaproteobacteria bacterium]NNC98464.1 hypothetical protein [Gammaproteobacteria bacterium]NNM14771.1 hypothetical protein [Gammaproteobacteria bacterium]
MSNNDSNNIRPDLAEFNQRESFISDAAREKAVAKRHALGLRTARENVHDLLDDDSMNEYGALAVAAQRGRKSHEELIENTPADGIITAVGTVNAHEFGDKRARCAVLAYDYTVLAGTQGFFNHKKTDRLLKIASDNELPVIFYTEGGGGRPGDVDADRINVSGLGVPTFAQWAAMNGKAPRIAINAGRCFAGNAVLFGLADITIATKTSNIGLAGPAMIEGGGLGSFKPEEIGPADVQHSNGVIDILVADEAEATQVAKKVLGYFQGDLNNWECTDQDLLRDAVPENRRMAYKMRKLIELLADTNSVQELRLHYGKGILTCLVRIRGQAFGLIANNPRHLGGAIDSESAEKAARFLQLCDAYALPVISLCDTPGFMVGPDSEKTASVRRGSRLLAVAANLQVPVIAVVTRKAYGLGAQAMVGGSFQQPAAIASWPSGEFGAMGLEGAVSLGFKKELAAIDDPDEREAVFNKMVAKAYQRGKAISIAEYTEVDAVIDPKDTRGWILRTLNACKTPSRNTRRFVDIW